MRTTWHRRVAERLRGEQRLSVLIEAGLSVGPGLWKERRTFIEADFPWAVHIGTQVTLSHDVRIIAHDSAARRHAGYTEILPVHIGNEAYIGAGSIILPGTTIGDRTIIGAGSVVRGTIPPDVVAAGVPARVLSSTEEYLDRKREQIASSFRVERPARLMTSSDHAAARAALARDGRIFLK